MKRAFFILKLMGLSYGEQIQHPKWIEKREAILIRDGKKCKICGCNLHHLEIHHLCYFPDLLAWEYDDELLISVCRKHYYELTYDMPKIAGLLAFQALKENVDLSTMSDILQKLKK